MGNMLAASVRAILGVAVVCAVDATTTTTTTTTSTDGGGWPWWAWFLLMLGICCFLAICCGGIGGGIFATKKKKKTEVYTGPVAYPAPQAPYPVPVQPPIMTTCRRRLTQTLCPWRLHRCRLRRRQCQWLPRMCLAPLPWFQVHRASFEQPLVLYA